MTERIHSVVSVPHENDSKDINKNVFFNQIDPNSQPLIGFLKNAQNVLKHIINTKTFFIMNRDDVDDDSDNNENDTQAL